MGNWHNYSSPANSNRRGSDNGPALRQIDAIAEQRLGFQKGAMHLLSLRTFATRLAASVLILCIGAGPLQAQTAGTGPVADAITHMRNLEYHEALAQLRSWVKEHPGDLRAWNYIGATLLYREMFRRGLLGAQIYGENGQAYEDKKKTPVSQSLQEELTSTLDHAQALAEDKLKQTPGDVDARYWLGVTHGTRASYLFTLQKSFLPALREGRKASDLHEQLLKENPGFADGQLIAGIRDYVAGVLPWYIKWLASFTGQGGNRDEGLKQIQQAAEHGNYAHEDAKVVLYVLS